MQHRVALASQRLVSEVLSNSVLRRIPKAYLAITLVWLLLYLPLLSGIRVLPWDAVDEFYPTVYFNAHSLRQAIAPWWNPYVYGGYPQIADPQGMLFSPILMTWMLIPANPGATWFAWGVLIHMLLGAWAVVAVLRQWEGNTFGATIGATVFIAGGVAASRMEHIPIVLAYAYAPIVLLALRNFVASPSALRGAMLGLASGALLTHLVQLTYLLVFMLTAYGVAASASHWGHYDRRQRWAWIRGMTIGLALALLIGMPQLIFSLAFVSLSNRSTLPLAAAANSSLDARALLTLISPNAWHALRGTYNGPASLVEAYLYLGALPLMFLAWISRPWQQLKQRRQLFFFAVVASISTLYMFGVHTAFYGWLYSWLPGIQQFRRPSDAAYLFNLAFAFIIGLTASHYPLHSRWTRLLLALAAAWLAISSLSMQGDGLRWQSPTICAALITALTWFKTRHSHVNANASQVAMWLFAVIVVDYRCFSLNGRFNQAHDAAQSFRRDDAAALVETLTRHRVDSLPSRIEPVDAGVYWDNQVVFRGIQSTQGYNPLRYGLYDRWYGTHESGNQSNPSTPYNPHAGSAVSNLLAAAYVIHKVNQPSGPISVWTPPADFERVFANKTTEIWRNPHAYSRMLTPLKAALRAPDQPPSPAAFAATDFSEKLWLTPRDSTDFAQAQTSLSHCDGHRLEVLEAQGTPTTLVLKTRSTAGAGWLVLADLDFPGWRATAGGMELPIHRANGMFRAVCVPAGEQVVRFSFHPWAMALAAWQERSSTARALYRIQ
jgi:hypothetical protein